MSRPFHDWFSWSLSDAVYVAAAQVRATEAVAFAARARLLDPLVHMRSDGADEAQRTAAIEAFREIIGRCIGAQEDGAIEVQADPPAPAGRQFCLVGLVAGDAGTVGAVACVASCRDEADALRRLDILRQYASVLFVPKHFL